MTIKESLAILKEWTETDSLRLHASVVANAMKSYGKYWNENEEMYTIVGLLHDMDYEKHPTAEEHPYVGAKFLESKGLPSHMINAILGHADYTGVPRKDNLSRSLFAVDELSGFITAVCYVTYPGKPKVKSVKKKLKDKSFAAKVDRAEIERAIEDLGVDRDEHIERVINAVWEIFEPFREENRIFPFE